MRQYIEVLTYIGVTDVDRIPIIDRALASAKLAEVMVEFKRAGLWKSKKTISKDVIEGLRKEYYHGSESISL